MTAAARQQRAHERHRAFLENVSGLKFGEPLLDLSRNVLVFSAGFRARACDGRVFVLVESRVADPEDFAS